MAKAFLVLASLFFYSYWNIDYLPLILVSMVVNYAVGNSFSSRQDTHDLQDRFTTKPQRHKGELLATDGHGLAQISSFSHRGTERCGSVYAAETPCTDISSQTLIREQENDHDDLVNPVKTKGLNSRRKASGVRPQVILTVGILLNLGLLGYFKYCDFFIENFNYLSSSSIQTLNLILPLAISFFTFQQIAYLVDSYRGETQEYDFLNYCLFVTFFPQLIAGPIVHHKEMMPQFARVRGKVMDWKNIYSGLLIFSIGIFKKVIIADTFALWATDVFDKAVSPNLIESWVGMLSYTFQIYFDFSGYTDMAVGAALLFNIVLPQNFNSPYKASDIQEFWRRWHMTLSRWLRDYLYIPLGGNRGGELITFRNLFITFLLGGLWHGAGWTFVIWGAMHGVGCCIHKLWQKAGCTLPKYIAWGLTFFYINITWIFFRAISLGEAVKVLKGIVGLNGIEFMKNAPFPTKIVEIFGIIKTDNWFRAVDAYISTVGLTIIGAMIIVVFFKNCSELDKGKWKDSVVFMVPVAVMFALAVCGLNRISTFLYFNF